MTDTARQNAIELLTTELNRPEWDEPIVCRVEVDLSLIHISEPTRPY